MLQAAAHHGRRFAFCRRLLQVHRMRQRRGMTIGASVALKAANAG